MSPTEILGDAWKLYGRFFSHLAAVGLTVYFFAAVIALVLALAGQVGVFLGQIVVLVASFLLTGALVTAVADVRDGRVDLSVGETLSKAVPFLGPLIVAGVLVSLAISLGLVLFIVPGLILMTIWFVLSPSIVLDDTGWWGSFGHSRELVRGYGWPVFGVIVLTALLLIVAGLVLGLILFPLPDWLAGFIATLVQGAVIAPFVAVATTLTFFRLKELKGGV